jgi:mono/diheme cytochrome c family protein
MSRLLLAFVVGASAVSAQDAQLATRALGVLEQRCVVCHGPALSQSGLRLDSRDAALKGGTRGPAIVAGNAAQSRLVQAIRRNGDVLMPPGPKLPDAEIATLERWIAAGAQWPAATAKAPAQTWWSFKPPVRPQPPAVKDAWVRTPVDAFILQKLVTEKLKPAREADRRTLARRAYLDLHGLPPTAEQLDKFANDSAADAYEKLIDELLASPRYGEKWGRHWLDLARYGDTAGFEQDPYLLYAWRYRDYVIDSFNNDKPYDRFVKEQIAGDELYPDDPPSMSGTGFYTVGPNRDMLYKVEDINRVETLIDWVDTTGSVFLGLTVGCARCHDHKFDPISQRDYMALQAIFHNAEKTRVFLQYDPARGYDLSENSRTARLWEIADQFQALGDGGRGGSGGQATPAPARSPEDEKKLRALEQQVVQMFRNLRPGPFAPGIHDIGRESPTKAYLPARNGRPPEPVPPGFLTVLGGGKVPEPPIEATTSGGRTALANWIATKDNPLFARVMVNRLWHFHFGRGLVATTSDLGHRAGAPSHPELLDWLATEFVGSGWDVRAMQRLIVTSATYRQSSTLTAALRERDPDNRLLARGPRQRLPAELIRDTALAASGLLNEKIGGPSVLPYQPAGLWEEMAFGEGFSAQSYVQSHGPDLYRRGMYTFWKRTVPPASLATFDAPDREKCTARRAFTNTPLQALTLMNDPTYVEAARGLAQRALLEGGTGESARIAYAFRLATARKPSGKETGVLKKLLERRLDSFRKDRRAAARLVAVGESARDARLDVSELAAWTTVASAILNLDETITKQ